MRYLIRLFNRQGFTLLELTLSLFIISVIVTISMPHLRGIGDRAQKAGCQANQQLIRGALDDYYLLMHQYPTSATPLQDLVNVKLLQDVPKCPQGGQYTTGTSIDGSTATVTCSVHGILPAPSTP